MCYGRIMKTNSIRGFLRDHAIGDAITPTLSRQLRANFFAVGAAVGIVLTVLAQQVGLLGP